MLLICYKILMAQAVHFRAVSFPSKHPCLYPARHLAQVVPTSSKPSPEVASPKPLGILLTLLKSTLAGVLATVGSKGLGDMLSPLAATFSKMPGEGHSIASPFLIPYLFSATGFAASEGTTEITPTSSGLPNRGVRILRGSA
jgi:hypothetical protein